MELVNEFLKADTNNPFMGLNNRVCTEPKYWCKAHQVWLSENDVQQKRCRVKPTFDMISTSRCNNLVEKGIGGVVKNDKT